MNMNGEKFASAENTVIIFTQPSPEQFSCYIERAYLDSEIPQVTFLIKSTLSGEHPPSVL